MVSKRKKLPTRSRQTPASSGRSPASHSRIRGAFRFLVTKWWLLVLLVLMIPVGIHISVLDARVREQFEGKRWELPARVYARPLELYSGMGITPENLTIELSALGYRESGELYNQGEFQRKDNELYIKTREFKFWDASEPSRMVRVRFQGETVQSVTEVQTNRNLALVRLEPKIIGKIYPNDNEDRVLVSLKEVPQSLINALLAMEDRGFFEHYGVSVKGLIRASMANLQAGELVQGGSTITQQLVKNLFLSPERTFDRKINEAAMALLLEWHYSKEEILEAYLNEIYLGQDGNRSIHGMGMAAWFYFNRPIEELSLSETALLISLVRAASHYNPRKHPERALSRRNLVLDSMVAQGFLNYEEATRAKESPLGISEESTDTASPYPAFLDLVRRQLRQDYREEDLRSSGLQIFTTLDPYLQNQAERSMANGLKKLEKSTGRRNLQGAMVVTNTESGEVLSIVNGKNPRYAGFNRPLDAVRQIGSLVKPSIYLTALQNQRYSLMSVLDDTPYEWRDKYGKVWSPNNYDNRSHGRVRLHRALANSYNLATVRLGMELGLSKVIETLRKLGIDREFPVFPSMLLGSLGLTPFEVTQMYQTIATGGYRVPLRSIRNVLTHDGKPLERYGLNIEKRFDAAPVFLLNHALQEAVRFGTGRHVAKTYLADDMIVAGKTGTSNDLRDSWFAGFGSDILTVTWLGRDDNKPVGLSGGSGAMYVWGNFVQAVRPKSLAPVPPDHVQWRWVDYNSGNAVNKGGPNAIKMPFIAGTDGETLAINLNPVEQQLQQQVEQ
ncbi:MAG: penicillin-binding protein 1B [Thiotrichaceae bacterium]|nr:penicillin-binding protein 1B [Thiotrichaceae bacterium]